jgi:hypothetical protein
MRKFDETMKYLNTLWESIFNPQLSMGSDFAESYNNINERLEALANLDYGKLTEESLDPSIKTYLSQDKILKRNPQVLTQSGWKGIFQDDFTIIKQSYQILLTKFKEGAIKLEQSGKWSKQESLHYRTALSMFLEILEVKYHDFRDLHKDLISDKIPNDGYTVMQWAIILNYINPEKYSHILHSTDKVRQLIKDFGLSYSYDNLYNTYMEFKSRVENTRSDDCEKYIKEKKAITPTIIQDMETALPKIKKISKEAFSDAKDDISEFKDTIDKNE